MSGWVAITDAPVYMRERGEFDYYESIKRELNKRLIVDSRCDARREGGVCIYNLKQKRFS